MNVLITGANGTVGSDLVNFFSEKNKVYAFYRTSNSASKNLKSKNIIWIKQDLRKKILYKINPKVIIHCVVVHPFSKKNTYLDYLDSNVIALKNVVEFAKEKKIDKFFYLSSFKIYGDIKNKILKDNNVFTSPDILGATKIFSEKILEQQKFNYLSIRLPGVITYYVKDSRRPWLNIIINKLINNKIINIYNAESLFNNVIDTIEIYRFINFIMKKKNMKNGSLNFSASNPIKIKSMIYNLKEKLHSKSKIILKKRKLNHYIILLNKCIYKYGFNVSSTSDIINRKVKIVKKNNK